MPLKDYYGILEIESSATIHDIKKAYRRLALQFHPDKNHNDPYAATQFAEIKEAYEVLTNPGRKEKYLQKRWYQQSTGSKKTRLPVTPVNLLKQTLELERYVSKLDVFRVDTAGLSEYILSLFDDSSIEQLNTFNEKEINEKIVGLLMNCLRVLPLNLVLSLTKQIEKINTSEPMQKKLGDFVSGRYKIYKREKYRIWMIILVVIVLCLVIIFSA